MRVVGQDGGAPVVRASEPERSARGCASGAARVSGQVRWEQGEGRGSAPPCPAWRNCARPWGTTRPPLCDSRVRSRPPGPELSPVVLFSLEAPTPAALCTQPLRDELSLQTLTWSSTWIMLSIKAPSLQERRADRGLHRISFLYFFLSGLV